MTAPLQKNVPIVDEQGYPTRYFIEFMLPKRTFSGVITTAPLTAGGTNGSMTFLNGQLISQVPAT